MGASAVQRKARIGAREKSLMFDVLARAADRARVVASDGTAGVDNA